MYGRIEMAFEQVNNGTGAVQYLHHDQAGSTRLIMGESGQVEGAYTYTPLRNCRSAHGLGHDAVGV
jgi:hypothetical protein